MTSRRNPKLHDEAVTNRQEAAEISPAPMTETAKPENGGRQDASIAARERRLAGMLTVAPDAIIAVGTNTNIRVFNPGAEELFGYKAADIIGKPLDELIPERYRAMHGSHVDRFRAAPEQSRLMTERSEIVGLRADGSEFPAEASVSKLEMDGETILTVMLHDVTARKQVEAELIAAKEQAEQALIQAEKMAAMGTLASGIGHEINNPLYAIMGASEAIRDGNDLARCQEHAEDIIGYCKHIAEIIKNLTGYIRPAEKHGLEPVEVNAAIAEAVSMAQLSRLDETIEIDQQLGDVPAISAKSEDIQQAFFNVIRNALQAMDSDGRLNIESSSESGIVSVRISDTGTGISPEDLAKIYDPFFTTKDPDQGEGIGLFVVQQIVNKYDGAIQFDSTVGEGTTCIMTFPTQQPDKEAP